MPDVFVELDPETELPTRIFKCTKKALKADPLYVMKMDRGKAVGMIRIQVIAKAIRQKAILCQLCGAVVTETTGEMHEVLPRGKGGEISLDNCIYICYNCHIGKQDSEHGDRRFQTSKERNETRN